LRGFNCTAFCRASRAFSSNAGSADAGLAAVDGEKILPADKELEQIRIRRKLCRLQVVLQASSVRPACSSDCANASTASNVGLLAHLGLYVARLEIRRDSDRRTSTGNCPALPQHIDSFGVRNISTISIGGCWRRIPARHRSPCLHAALCKIGRRLDLSGRRGALQCTDLHALDLESRPVVPYPKCPRCFPCMLQSLGDILAESGSAPKCLRFPIRKYFADVGNPQCCTARSLPAAWVVKKENYNSEQQDLLHRRRRFGVSLSAVFHGLFVCLRPCWLQEVDVLKAQRIELLPSAAHSCTCFNREPRTTAPHHVHS